MTALRIGWTDAWGRRLFAAWGRRLFAAFDRHQVELRLQCLSFPWLLPLMQLADLQL